MAVRLLKPDKYEERRYEEQSFKECNKDYLALKSMREELDRRVEELNKELDRLSYLRVDYKDLEIHFEGASRELKFILETVGFSLDSTKNQTMKACEIFDELEAYVGLRETLDFGIERARIPKGAVYKEVNGKMVEQDIIEINQYVRDFF